MIELIKEIIQRDNLASKSRNAPLRNKRMYLYNIMRDRGMIYEQIGDYFNRDHSTVVHAVKVYNNLIEAGDMTLIKDIEEYENIFNPKSSIDYARLVEDIKNASTLGGFNIIKRKLENNLY